MGASHEAAEGPHTVYVLCMAAIHSFATYGPLKGLSREIRRHLLSLAEAAHRCGQRLDEGHFLYIQRDRTTKQ